MERSESVGALAAALAKAQGSMAAARKDSANPFYKSKYADLASIVDAIKQPLAENGLAYVQATDVGDDSAVIVETVLLHASGEWIASRLRMKPVQDTPQGLGSCISYARRYGLQALVGIPADDDDGNAASGTTDAAASGNAHPPKGPATKESATKEPAPKGPATKEPATKGHDPDLLPDNPAEMQAWFRARVQSLKPLKWSEDTKTDAAKRLAIGLKKHGLGDVNRLRAYELLTGKPSGKDMEERELYLLGYNNSEIGAQKLLALVRWSEQAVDTGS